MNRADLPVVQTAGLTKVFKDFWRRDRVVAVDDLNIEVQRGEVFGLLGPNGSGKSTTIKMLLGLLYPTRGRISVFGRPPTDVAVKAKIGFLPEESLLYRFLNARETLDLYGRIFQLNGRCRKERIDKLLDMVGLYAEANRRIGEYSKGMARRIGLAQALINDPDLLILDEPTAGLDPIGIRQIKDVIRELARKGKTILLSSHLLADVEDVCDRITILYGGRKRASGPIAELLSREDRTQITTEKLSEETIEKVRQVVHESEDKRILKVGAPSDRLETFFMRTIEEAEAANVQSSGVRRSGALPDFIGTASPPDVIDELLSAADDKSPAATPQPIETRPQEPPEEPAGQIIEQLTRGRPEPAVPDAGIAETDEAAPPEEPAYDQPQVHQADRSVIEGLVGGHKDGNDG
ncbi:MAG: ATP-binding cassette domain-containing protein [Phycisphaerae bacterium]